MSEIFRSSTKPIVAVFNDKERIGFRIWRFGFGMFKIECGQGIVALVIQDRVHVRFWRFVAAFKFWKTYERRVWCWPCYQRLLRIQAGRFTLRFLWIDHGSFKAWIERMEESMWPCDTYGLRLWRLDITFEVDRTAEIRARATQ